MNEEIRNSKSTGAVLFVPTGGLETATNSKLVGGQGFQYIKNLKPIGAASLVTRLKEAFICSTGVQGQQSIGTFIHSGTKHYLIKDFELIDLDGCTSFYLPISGVITGALAKNLFSDKFYFYLNGFGFSNSVLQVEESNKSNYFTSFSIPAPTDAPELYASLHIKVKGASKTEEKYSQIYERDDQNQRTIRDVKDLSFFNFVDYDQTIAIGDRIATFNNPRIQNFQQFQERAFNFIEKIDFSIVPLNLGAYTFNAKRIELKLDFSIVYTYVQIESGIVVSESPPSPEKEVLGSFNVDVGNSEYGTINDKYEGSNSSTPNIIYTANATGTYSVTDFVFEQLKPFFYIYTERAFYTNNLPSDTRINGVRFYIKIGDTGIYQLIKTIEFPIQQEADIENYTNPATDADLVTVPAAPSFIQVYARSPKISNFPFPLPPSYPFNVTSISNELYIYPSVEFYSLSQSGLGDLFPVAVPQSTELTNLNYYIGGLGNALISGQSTPPVAGEFSYLQLVGPYLVGISGNKIRWSAANDPSVWPSTNFVILVPAGETIIKIIQSENRLYAVTKRAIYEISGTFETALAAERLDIFTTGDIGAVESIFGFGIFRFSTDGIFVMSSGAETKISTPIQDIFDGTNSFYEKPEENLHIVKADDNVMFFYNIRVNSATGCLVYNVSRQKFYYYEYDFVINCISELLYVLTTDGRVLHLGREENFIFQPVEWEMKTGSFVNPMRRHFPRKLWHDIVNYDENNPPTIRIYLDEQPHQTFDVYDTDKFRLFKLQNGETLDIEIFGVGRVKINSVEIE
jgi:hypothetical protein